MKIKPGQLDQLASLLMASYKKQDLIIGKAADGVIKNKIIEVIARNFADEKAIEEEARAMLASVGPASRELDPFKMFLLAKQKLAAKKGFIL